MELAARTVTVPLCSLAHLIVVVVVFVAADVVVTRGTELEDVAGTVEVAAAVVEGAWDVEGAAVSIEDLETPHPTSITPRSTAANLRTTLM
jgi:hypothetical protein